MKRHELVRKMQNYVEVFIDKLIFGVYRSIQRTSLPSSICITSLKKRG